LLDKKYPSFSAFQTLLGQVNALLNHKLSYGQIPPTPFFLGEDFDLRDIP
jgi:hypothetical protein